MRKRWLLGRSGLIAALLLALLSSCDEPESMAVRPAPSENPVRVTVHVERSSVVGKLTEGYAGFSFEKTHITDPFFSTQDAPLMALHRLLGAGLVRIGANDVDRATWQADAPLGTASNPLTVVGTAAVDQLAAFLERVGWRVIYGLPLKTAAPADAAAEAAYAAHALGDHLAWFELGNELNAYGDWPSVKSRWEATESAVLAAAPSAKLAGPAVFGQTSYAESFARDESGKFSLVTYHYYRGSAAAAGVSLRSLLLPDPALAPELQALASITTSYGIADGYRLDEANSYSHHGAPGVSNAYGAALWAVEFMLSGAELGASGVNFHGGGDNMDGNTCSSGPSSCLLPFSYSPIVESASSVVGAAPVFYGMLLVSQLGAGNLLSTSSDASGVDLRAHALALSDGSIKLVLINDEPATALNVSLDIDLTLNSASALYLSGTSLDSTSLTGITYAGSSVSASGAWTPQPPAQLPVSNGKLTVMVPAASAVVVSAR